MGIRLFPKAKNMGEFDAYAMRLRDTSNVSLEELKADLIESIKKEIECLNEYRQAQNLPKLTKAEEAKFWDRLKAIFENNCL